MYGKCGPIDESQHVFDRMTLKNSVSCRALLGGYCQRGDFDTVIELLRNWMRSISIASEQFFEPVQMPARNLIKLNSMICGFTQNREALRMFNEMVKEGINPDYINFIGVLFACSHAGLVDQGRKHFTSMNNMGLKPRFLVLALPVPNSVIAERIAKKMMKLEPDYNLSYVLLANVYRAVGQWNDALKTWRLMQGRGFKKMPGKSWI
ncbi:pentatricopeptide repeat-containing protein At1g03540-like [Actinidia eriantha]|uniref:pentatricopeptide repeat-containing protein At1g03540-like n=1 Tax=Actinidia eriantha TaxID=165200 RepID=UPI00258C922C|nr:pentatricopeptide repeat-containing protein At1g03540-like [Actinidia eriantha]